MPLSASAGTDNPGQLCQPHLSPVLTHQLAEQMENESFDSLYTQVSQTYDNFTLRL